MQEGARRLYQDRKSGRLYQGRTRRRHRERGRFHDRLPRGERAEAIALVAQTMLGQMTIGNMRIVNISTGRGLSIAQLGGVTGMSIERVKGAVHDLVSCGYLGGFQARKIREGTYRGEIATRWITRELLKAIGCWRAFNRFRSGDSKTAARAASGPARRIVDDLARAKSAPDPRAGELAAKIAALEFEIGREHPTWTAAEVAAAARARLR